MTRTESGFRSPIQMCSTTQMETENNVLLLASTPSASFLTSLIQVFLNIFICTFAISSSKLAFTIHCLDGSYVVTDSCEVPEEFSGTQFQPSIDGLYNLEIMNDADTLDISRIGQLRIEAYGTNQDYKKQENMIEIH